MSKKTKQEMTYTDPLGREIPARYVSGYDKARDRIAKRLLKLWRDEEQRLKKLKATTFDLIDSLRETAAKDTGTEIGGAEGYLQFRDFAGRILIRFDNVKQSEFDARLEIAQKLVSEAIEEMAGDTSKNPRLASLRKIAEAAFKPRGRAGKLDRQRVRDIAEMQIDHPKWREAAEIIRECDQVVGHKRYVRVGEIPAPEAKPQYISLDISAV